MTGITKYNVPYHHRFKLCTVNTKDVLVLSEEDWMQAKHLKWYRVMASCVDLKKNDIVNAQLVKLEDYCNISGTRMKDIPYTEFRREFFT